MRFMMDALEVRTLCSYGFRLDGTVSGGQLSAPELEDSSSTIVSQFRVTSKGTLFVSGTGPGNRIVLVVQGGKIVGGNSFVFIVKDPSVRGDTIKPVETSNVKGIKRIAIDSLGGSDKVVVFADVPVRVDGGSGSDTIQVFAPTVTVAGGSGKNTITQGAGRTFENRKQTIPPAPNIFFFAGQKAEPEKRRSPRGG